MGSREGDSSPAPWSRTLYLQLVLMLTTMGVVAHLWMPSQAPLYDLVDELRARGEPYDLSGFVPPQVPTDENGAPLLIAALEWVDETHGEDWRRTYTGNWDLDVELPFETHASPGQMAELTVFLDTFDPFLRHVKAAISRPAIQFETTGLDADLMPKVDEVLSISALREVLGTLAVAGRRESTRMDAIEAQFRMPLRWQRGSLIMEMVAIASSSMACIELRDGIERGRLDAVEARRRLGEMLKEEAAPRIRSVLGQERAYFLHLWFAGLDGRGPLTKGQWQRRSFGPYPEDGRLSLHHRADHMLAFSQLVDALQQLEIRADRDDSVSFSKTYANAQRQYPILLGFPLVFERLQRLDATRALARVGLALAVHENDTGEFPATLDELDRFFPDGMPIDLYSGEPFEYHSTDSGVRLASIGSKHLREEAVLLAEFDDEDPLRESGLVWELTGRGGPPDSGGR